MSGISFIELDRVCQRYDEINGRYPDPVHPGRDVYNFIMKECAPKPVAHYMLVRRSMPVGTFVEKNESWEVFKEELRDAGSAVSGAELLKMKVGTSIPINKIGDVVIKYEAMSS